MPQALIFQEVARFFEEFVPESLQGKSVCAAVSGGCDSVALFHALSGLRDRLGIARLGIAHVNHRLRGAQSDADAAFVKEISVAADVPFHEKVLGPKPKGLGMEEWARAERYIFFSDLGNAEGYNYIATGHTADDQAETVFMRIMRGCGLKGLCAIAPVRKDRVIRPLLYIKRASLCAWLMETHAAFREDFSNKDVAYHRNLVRHKLLPAFSTREPLAMDLLPRIARGALASWQALVYSINKWSALYVVSKHDGQFAIRTTGFVDYPFVQEAVAEVLRQNRIRFNQRHIEDIISNATRTRGIFLLPGGWHYRCGRDIIQFTKQVISKVPAAFPSPSMDIPNSPRSAGLKQGTPSSEGEGKAAGTPVYEIMIGSTVVCESANVCIETKLFPGTDEPLCFSQDNMTVFLDAGVIKGPMEFRNVKPNDCFQPLGCGELRNVREYLKKRKINHRTRGVVVEKSGEVIWIPGVQISHRFRVTPQTEEILKFYCKNIQ
jgi:tRNA(Ile)-lysidine synthase